MLRRLLIWVLALALPLQGVAATLMVQCSLASSHQVASPGAASMAARHAGGVDQATVVSAQPDAQSFAAPEASAAADGSCSACHYGCTAATPRAMPTASLVALTEPAPDVGATGAFPLPGLDRLERPPRRAR